jgi:CBS domain-containing protein
VENGFWTIDALRIGVVLASLTTLWREKPMWIPKELGWMATRLKEGHRVNRITVRDLLRLFKAERRGLNKVHDIRSALESLGLQTEPDFESEWIDGRIRICLQNGTNGDVGQALTVEPEESPAENDTCTDEQEGGEADQLDPGNSVPVPIVISDAGEGVVETKLSEPPDPTFRIGSLPASNKPLVTVGQDDPLTKAVTKMLQFDYSQLPIMHGDREVKGMISWKSIASRYAIGGECIKVQHCREDAQVVDGNGTLFDAIPTIVKQGYVLVRSQHDRRITGIVTASDLSLQFQQLAEPFLLLREIELHIRQLLEDKVTAEDLGSLASADAATPTPKSISDLSFGGYVRLLQRPQVWAKLAISIDQGSLTSQLEEVRGIRNDVMHFDPDPMTPDQLDVLKNTARFMQRLYELLP